MLKKTCLNSCHIDAGGKMVDFGGWEMPIHYGSQLDEHQWVRESAGMFDVSHMTVIDILGSEAKAFLRKLLANDVDRLNAWQRCVVLVLRVWPLVREAHCS